MPDFMRNMNRTQIKKGLAYSLVAVIYFFIVGGLTYYTEGFAFNLVIWTGAYFCLLFLCGLILEHTIDTDTTTVIMITLPVTAICISLALAHCS